MCMYRTYQDGSLVIENMEPKKVEILYQIKKLGASLSVHKELDKFVAQAEQVLFEEHGKYFHAWLFSMSAVRRQTLPNMEELTVSGRDDVESDTKQRINHLLRRFLTLD